MCEKPRDPHARDRLARSRSRTRHSSTPHAHQMNALTTSTFTANARFTASKQSVATKRGLVVMNNSSGPKRVRHEIRTHSHGPEGSIVADGIARGSRAFAGAHALGCARDRRGYIDTKYPRASRARMGAMGARATSRSSDHAMDSRAP